MASRSHQAFFYWTCLGKFLIPWGSQEGGTFPRHVHQNLRKFIPRKEKRCLPKVVEMCNASTRMEKVENFPIWKNRKFFFQNLMNWNICSRGKFSTFQFFRKLWNFIYPGPEVSQFSDRLEKVEIFPIKSDELDNFQKLKISDKSEKFPLYQL